MAQADEIEPRPPLKTRALAVIIWAVARLIGMTARVQYENRETMDLAVRSGKGAILVAWHGRTLVPANVLRGRGYWALISLSRDGALQNAIFRRFGYQTVRGSTNRGGVRATLKLARLLSQGGVLTFTPDGPRGPTHKVQPGVLLLAARSGCPVIPIGISARPRILVRSWDRYMVPAPFSRVAWVVGEPIHVGPDDRDRPGVSEQIERALNRCEKRAEELLGFAYPEDFPV